MKNLLKIFYKETMHLNGTRKEEMKYFHIKCFIKHQRASKLREYNLYRNMDFYMIQIPNRRC